MRTTSLKADHTVSVAQLPGSTKLGTDYVAEFSNVASFYGGGKPDLDGLKASVGRASSRTMPREEVSHILVDQNTAWGMPQAVIENARALARPDSAAIVTGQQVGILGGPLYTVYKTISAIRLARDLSDATGRPVVPVFWVEGEDHDFDEIASISVLRANDIHSLKYDGTSAENPGAVGRLTLNDGITSLIDELEAMLPPSDFHAELFEALHDAYAPGRSIEDAFVSWWKRLFGSYGLVFMNPDDVRFKELTIPLFEHELNDSAAPAQRIEEASGRLLAGGYHAQVNARPTNLFVLHDEGRLPVDVDDDGFVLRGTDLRLARDEMLAMLRAEPELFSPNVVLRPLMQDLLIPTAAYVAGPGEISYFAQYRGVYEWAEIDMPVIYPRATATLVEPKVEKVFERYDLSLQDFVPGVDELFGRLVRMLSQHDLENEFSRLVSALNQGINDVKPVIEKVDKNLGRTTEATRAAIIKEVDRLKERAFRAEKRQHDELRSQLEKAWVNILPTGRLQERVLSPIYFLNKYGFGLIEQLFEAVDVAERDHQLLSL